jgi:hypothetical protein
MPNRIFGNGDCKPYVANLDSDGLDERVVHCREEWRIIYTNGTFAGQMTDGVRHVPLGYENRSALPGKPVFGGLSYERTMQIRNYMRDLGMSNIPPLFDYLITPYEYCSLPWGVADMPAECR